MQEFEDQQEPEERTDGNDGNGRISLRLIVIVLLILALLGVGRMMGSGGGGSNTGGGATGGSGSFDVAQEAFNLAKGTEDYRAAKPYGGNYGKIAVILTDSNGIVQSRYDHDPFQGHNPPAFHAEPVAVKWASSEVTALSQQGLLKGYQVHIILLTQVRGCSTCISSAASWAQQLDTAAGQHVKFSYWEIRNGSPSGFSPSDYPGGPATPGGKHGRHDPPQSVRAQDLNEIFARP